MDTEPSTPPRALRTTEARETISSPLLAALSESAQHSEDHALSPRTRELYAADWRRFLRWCESAGVIPLPAAPEAVRAYVMSMALTVGPESGTGYAVSTIERHLAGISHAHTEAGHPSPSRHPRVLALMKGLRRQYGTPPRRMRPLLLDDIRTILAEIDCSTWPAGVAGIRDTFVLLAGFSTAMRRAELAAVRESEVKLIPTGGLLIRIPVSKSDQQRQGAVVVAPRGQDPRTCPVCAYLRWTAVIDAEAQGRQKLMRAVLSTSTWQDRDHICRDAEAWSPASSARGGEYLLRAVLRGGHLAGPISGDALHRIVQRRAAAAGITGDIGFHSLRAGFVTQARRNGADARSVRRQTRHASDTMVDVYDREYSPLIDNAASELGL